MFKNKTIPFYPNTIPIVFATDDNYAPYMSATIQSIVENASPDKNYAFFILYSKITNETVNLLHEQVAHYEQFNIGFVNLTDYVSKYKFFVSRHITIETYFRLFIPELFYEYQKVIYLDCDMIVCIDIAELFEINLENNILAAMRDINISNSYYHYKQSNKINDKRNSLSKLKNFGDYFCAGLCVFNISLFRKTIIQDEMLEFATANEWDFHDQDVLNIFAEGKTLLLSFHWGVYTTKIQYLPENKKNEYIDAQKYPKIIHFTNKPWKSDIHILHFEWFWKYATRTPFIDVIISRMDTGKHFKDVVISRIHKRGGGMSLKFILVDCVKAWLFRIPK